MGFRANNGTDPDDLWPLFTPGILQHVTRCDNLWQHVIICDNMLQHVIICDNMLQHVTTCVNIWQNVTTCDNHKLYFPGEIPALSRRYVEYKLWWRHGSMIKHVSRLTIILSTYNILLQKRYLNLKPKLMTTSSQAFRVSLLRLMKRSRPSLMITLNTNLNMTLRTQASNGALSGSSSLESPKI